LKPTTFFMKEKYTLLVFGLVSFGSLFGQTLTIHPYLQDASPNSIYVLWETSDGEESIVEWGLTDTLGMSSDGSFMVNNGGVLHEVPIENLERYTKYYYRVKTGNLMSEIYSFKTPPYASDHESVRIVAMSDMQRDNAFPDKFKEIVEDGILHYLSDHFGDDVSEHLALVMIPGDLVQNGNNFSSWKDAFFNPSQDLFSRVPVYPVPGNHEGNSPFYFQYFKLPENGTPGFDEHWWYKDYGNVRIVGMDSNGSYAGQEQLDWLETVLDETCGSDSIDFVFAQLHHPYKSELWTPGESDFTGDVVHRLEQFTADCGKPSIHFFGHTHAYSRGQSRDHKHLWINVATAGGAIDNWGEFPNFDYDEFSVSQDDYGFVSVEITDDADPKIVIKRISRGDQDVIIDNQLTDSLVIRLIPAIVATPVPVSPKEEELAPECVTLIAGSFASVSNPGALHGQSHWQIGTDQVDFDNPVFESWKNFENWYGEVDTQVGDDLTDEQATGLSDHTSYWWRVRYRDREMNWSDWSSAIPFTTGASIQSPNLLINPGAEDSLSNWVVLEGVVEALTANVCAGVPPHTGDRYFVVGGLCTESALARCMQEVHVGSHADSIDSGKYKADFGGYLSNYGGQDLPEMKLIFLDQDAVELGTSNTISTLSNSWVMVGERTTIPAQTRIIQVELKGTRNAGVDNDSYFDDLFLRLGTGNTECDDLSRMIYPYARIIPSLAVVPNPIESRAYISLSAINGIKTRLFVVDAKGTKVDCAIKYETDKIVIEKGTLPSGTYFFWLRADGRIVGNGKFLIL
jgi:hypothetical protein